MPTKIPPYEPRYGLDRLIQSIVRKEMRTRSLSDEQALQLFADLSKRDLDGVLAHVEEHHPDLQPEKLRKEVTPGRVTGTEEAKRLRESRRIARAFLGTGPYAKLLRSAGVDVPLSEVAMHSPLSTYTLTAIRICYEDGVKEASAITLLAAHQISRALQKIRARFLAAMEPLNLPAKDDPSAQFEMSLCIDTLMPTEPGGEPSVRIKGDDMSLEERMRTTALEVDPRARLEEGEVRFPSEYTEEDYERVAQGVKQRLEALSDKLNPDDDKADRLNALHS